MSNALVLSGELEQTLPCVALAVVPHLSNPREAFAWALPASRALPANELAPLNVDIKLAPAIVLGALRQILPFRAALSELPGFNLTALDALEPHARATLHAEAQYMGVSAGPARLAELAKQARSWRRLLLQDMTILILRGLLPVKKQAELKIQAGYKDLPYLLLALIQLYREQWPTLSTHSTMREHELDEAENIGQQLVFAFALRAERHAVIRAANEQRQRNFTLLARAYDQVRRGLSYLRWHEHDLDTIAPSLYRGRGGSRRKAAEQAVSSPKVAPAPTGIASVTP